MWEEGGRGHSVRGFLFRPALQSQVWNKGDTQMGQEDGKSSGFKELKIKCTYCHKDLQQIETVYVEGIHPACSDCYSGAQEPRHRYVEAKSKVYEGGFKKY